MPTEPATSLALVWHKRYRRLIYSETLRDWVRRFILHVLTGFLAVAAHYSLMWLLLHGGMAAVPASTLGFVAGAATRFLLSYLHVFSPSDAMPATLFRFLLALGFQMLANMALLDGLLRLGLGLWAAQVATTIILTFANYVIYRLWVFR